MQRSAKRGCLGRLMDKGDEEQAIGGAFLPRVAKSGGNLAGTLTSERNAVLGLPLFLSDVHLQVESHRVL